MNNFTDKLVEDYAHSELYKTLLSLYDRFEKQKIIKNGETYIPHTLETEFFNLLRTRRAEMLTVENFELTKKINDLVYYVLTNVEVNGARNLMNGQTTYNASAVTEYGLHKNYGWSYGGDGVLDHEYQHTGKGFGGADFKLTAPITITIFVKGHGVKLLTIPAGTEIDAKDYMTRDTMDAALKANTDGSLGHYGNSLFVHIISRDDYYITKNKADATVFPVLEFSTKTERIQVKLSLGDDGILIVEPLVH